MAKSSFSASVLMRRGLIFRALWVWESRATMLNRPVNETCEKDGEVSFKEDLILESEDEAYRAERSNLPPLLLEPPS
jgi:hypothetical protein